MNPLVPEGMIEGWRIVQPNWTSRNGFRYPFPQRIDGEWVSWAVCDHDLDSANLSPRPTRPGDGLGVAKTWKGAALGGILTAYTALLIAYYATDVLGEDDDAIRVRRMLVLDAFDPQQLLRLGWGEGANLQGALLRYANLYGANLRGADLGDANLYRSDLCYADLRDAKLAGANMRGADLRGADLRGADLTDADLRDALGALDGAIR